MISVFDIIAHLGYIWPEYPGVIVVPFALLFAWYAIGGSYYLIGHSYSKINNNKY